MRSVVFNFVLTVFPGRSVTDSFWQEIETSHIQVWDQAMKVLEAWRYTLPEGSLQIEVNWRPIVTRYRRDFRLRSILHDPAQDDETKLKAVEGLFGSTVRVPMRVTVDSNLDRLGAKHAATHHAECYLYDVFLIMNLAAPGCCTFGSAKLRFQKSELPHLSDNVELSLSEFSFDVSYFQGLEGTWPAPSLLALEQVVGWYRKVRSTSSQIPASRTEKVLFALLHICRTDISLNTVIWLFYALEALLDTNPGENRRTLVARSALILSPTPHQRKYLKKNLHSLYELRSSFVHGGREVAHPMHNEALDNRVEAGYTEMARSIEFGFAVLLTCLQELIGRQWHEAHFKETVTGSKDE